VARFLVVDRSDVSAEEQEANADPAQARAGMDAWMALGDVVTILEGHPHLMVPGDSLDVLPISTVPGM
jgi:hypothetical protein